MTKVRSLTRRSLLARGAALIGCSAAAHPLLTTVTFASAPGDARLVVLILRGAMDGLDVVRPVADPLFATHRQRIVAAGEGEPGVPLDGFFEMHPALAPLAPLWSAGHLGFAHAVSTPYRNKRSHFDGQDILEAGTGLDVPDHSRRDGWLNRMLQSVPGLNGQTAYAIGRDQLKVLDGSARVINWSPDAIMTVSPQARQLLDHVYHEDPLFRDAATEAMELAEFATPDEAKGAAKGQQSRSQMAELASFAADRLSGEARIAAFSLSGWDTHRNQASFIARALGELSETILTLREGLGPVWDRTTILAMTEFGRTVRENGTGGTDHGTGGAMLMAGGAVRGGRVLGRWPGLAESDLYERRDLMPTGDVRAYAAWTMRGLFGIDRRALESEIFPGLDLGRDPGLLL